ncbi:hypothetical protein [Teichococcus oryzae]|uniref:Uncharacterized protein n=1 Tax=Teichococcus oryzae TaxID=1608942 RepID=A0A5B2TJR3_9PROT|nr:hypothetical protein [Pseudoroseomonas oryzae]KAA2214721.1 hypothetical protein F0Q34_03220 [Pseudoroseomonas oryzae]
MPRLSAQGVFRAHCWVIALATLGHVLSRIMAEAKGRESSITKVLNFAAESSIPTVVSVAGLLAAALAAWLIAADAREKGERLWRSWALVLAMILFLALDEGAALHDRMAFPMQSLMDLGGIFYIGWVVPYIGLVVVSGALLVPLVLKLPRRTLLRLVVAGTLFIGCALGLELVESALIHQSAGEGVPLQDADIEALVQTPMLTFLMTLEELGEMLAVALALRALLLHLTVDRAVTALELTPAIAPARRLAPASAAQAFGARGGATPPQA